VKNNCSPKVVNVGDKRVMIERIERIERNMN
jgi:uncharacterized protein (UPF0335 family)